jgi:protease II
MNKTIMHIALEAGPRVTEVMVKQLKLSNDAQCNDKYLYQAKEGVQYSLDEYVRRFTKDVNAKEKKVLLQCLEQNKINWRHLRSVMADQGEQLQVYCGLPAAYAKAWVKYDKSRG